MLGVNEAYERQGSYGSLGLEAEPFYRNVSVDKSLEQAAPQGDSGSCLNFVIPDTDVHLLSAGP